jgi:hypothetical protein
MGILLENGQATNQEIDWLPVASVASVASVVTALRLGSALPPSLDV